VRGRKSPSPIDLAHGLYNSLYYRTSGDKLHSNKIRKMEHHYILYIFPLQASVSSASTTQSIMVMAMRSRKWTSTSVILHIISPACSVIHLWWKCSSRRTLACRQVQSCRKTVQCGRPDSHTTQK